MTDLDLDPADDADSADREVHELLRGWGDERRRELGSPPLFQMPRERSRAQGSGRALLTAVAAAATVLAVCAGAVVGVQLLRQQSPRPAASATASTPAVLAVDASSDLRPFITTAALTRPLEFDGGALRLNPPVSPPTDPAAGQVDEATAIAWWRSGPFGIAGGTVLLPTPPLVFRASISIAIPIADDPQSPVRAARPAQFDRRDGWVVTFPDTSVYNCPAFPQSLGGPALQPPRPSASVWLLSGDRQTAAAYRTAGTKPCTNQISGPTSTTSGISTRATSGDVADPRQQSCSYIGPTSPGGDGVAARSIVTTLAPGPCTGGNLQPGQAPGPLLVTYNTSSSGGLDYDDGALHHIP